MLAGGLGYWVSMKVAQYARAAPVAWIAHPDGRQIPAGAAPVNREDSHS
jgi:hypothetical protein